MDANPVTLEPISPGSVVDVAYRRIRTLIEDGELGPSTRLRQGDLADALAISRTSVREALHRLTADELVEFKANRGFFVASFRLDAVLERLELRRILEPGFVRLATERFVHCTDGGRVSGGVQGSSHGPRQVDRRRPGRDQQLCRFRHPTQERVARQPGMVRAAVGGP